MVQPNISFCSLSLELNLSVGIIFAIVILLNHQPRRFLAHIPQSGVRHPVLSGKKLGTCFCLIFIIHQFQPRQPPQHDHLPSLRNGRLTFSIALDQLSSETNWLIQRNGFWSLSHIPPSVIISQPVPLFPVVRRLSFLSHSWKTD